MRISITDRCNLRCRYCMPEGVELVPMKNILSYEEIEMVCQAAAKAGIRKFKITGGEPLVRLGCPELIGKIKKIPGDYEWCPAVKIFARTIEKWAGCGEY